MARNAVVLSPELNNVGRREGFGLTAISTATLVVYSNATIQGIAAVPVGTKPPLNLVVTENIATAQTMDYVYLLDENIFFQSLPKGAVVNLKALDGTYNPADEVEIAADGNIQPLAAGVAVGVIPLFGGAVVGGGAGYDFIEVELY